MVMIKTMLMLIMMMTTMNMIITIQTNIMEIIIMTSLKTVDAISHHHIVLQVVVQVTRALPHLIQVQVAHYIQQLHAAVFQAVHHIVLVATLVTLTLVTLALVTLTLVATNHDTMSTLMNTNITDPDLDLFHITNHTPRSIIINQDITMSLLAVKNHITVLVITIPAVMNRLNHVMTVTQTFPFTLITIIIDQRDITNLINTLNTIMNTSMISGEINLMVTTM